MEIPTASAATTARPPNAWSHWWFLYQLRVRWYRITTKPDRRATNPTVMRKAWYGQ